MLIKEKDVDIIMELAHNLFKVSTGPVNREILLFSALEDYLISKGEVPGFTTRPVVKQKEPDPWY